MQNWDVLLHGNPAVDIYNGLKLAAGGELGIGVGEEEWGSGEREVLESFTTRTEGLVDAVVSRFGDMPKENELASHRTFPSRSTDDTAQSRSWLAAGAQPSPSDGVIFSGVGALTRASLRDVSAWNEWVYMYGQAAYGVQENPHSGPRKKRRKINHADLDLIRHSAQRSESPNNSRSELQNETLSGNRREAMAISSIPPPIIRAAGRSAKHAHLSSETQKLDSKARKEGQQSLPLSQDERPTVATDTIMKYMTLGLYGSSWGIPLGRPAAHRNASSYRQQDNSGEDFTPKINTTPLLPVEPKPVITHADSVAAAGQRAIHGMFIVGLQGDLEDEEETEDEDNGTDGYRDQESGSKPIDWNDRLLVRTLYVERTKRSQEGQNESSDTYYDRLRVIIYVVCAKALKSNICASCLLTIFKRRPFIFTFLFELQTVSLSMASFYRSIHHQFGPLQRPLLASTSPSKISQRLWEAADPKSTTSADSAQPIYDLVYDPSNLTVHTTIPNIPNSGTFAAEGLEPSEASWTRIEALNVHSQILNTYISTRRRALELERTCKTNRGWWVVWMRLHRTGGVQQTASMPVGEAFLIRKASDYAAPSARKASSMFSRGASENSGWGPGKLAEGIGIDTRRYIEGLLSLNR